MEHFWSLMLLNHVLHRELFFMMFKGPVHNSLLPQLILVFTLLAILLRDSLLALISCKPASEQWAHLKGTVSQVPNSRDGSFFSRVFNRSPVSHQNSISSSYSNSRQEGDEWFRKLSIGGARNAQSWQKLANEKEHALFKLNISSNNKMKRHKTKVIKLYWNSWL
jgi:hypothetical protein